MAFRANRTNPLLDQDFEWKHGGHTITPGQALRRFLNGEKVGMGGGLHFTVVNDKYVSQRLMNVNVLMNYLDSLTIGVRNRITGYDQLTFAGTGTKKNNRATFWNRKCLFLDFNRPHGTNGSELFNSIDPTDLTSVDVQHSNTYIQKIGDRRRQETWFIGPSVPERGTGPAWIKWNQTPDAMVRARRNYADQFRQRGWATIGHVLLPSGLLNTGVIQAVNNRTAVREDA